MTIIARRQSGFNLLLGFLSSERRLNAREPSHLRLTLFALTRRRRAAGAGFALGTQQALLVGIRIDQLLQRLFERNGLPSRVYQLGALTRTARLVVTHDLPIFDVEVGAVDDSGLCRRQHELFRDVRRIAE